MYNGKYTQIRDFSGGYCGNFTPTSLAPNQAADLDNIVIKPGGLGIRMRNGNTSITGASAINGGSPITAAGFYYVSATLEYVVIISNNKFMHRGNDATSFTDATGAATVSGYVDFFNFNGNLIGIGGGNPPFKWDTSTNIAALGGSPPSAKGGFTVNNRVFGYNTSGAPSTIYWSILGNAEDWTGSGSGSAVAGALDDQAGIIGHAILSTNYVLLFTSTSTFQIVTTANPFPIYTVFKDVGLIGSKAVVVVDGRAHWINQKRRMVSTDGEDFQEYPEGANDLWASVQTSQLSNITGWRQTGTDYDWIVWSVSTSGSSNNLGIIWDLKHKCWLKCSTGYNGNAVTRTHGTTTVATMKRDGVYMATSTGFVHRQDQSTFVDSSNSQTVISSSWQSGWINPSTLDNLTQVNRIGLELAPQASGSVTVSYGYDFITSFSTFTISTVATGSESYVFRFGNPTRLGNVFRYKISFTSPDAVSSLNLNSIIFRGKIFGQRRLV